MATARLIAFDLDGTLIDSRADLTTAVNLMRQRFGLPPLPLATVTSYVGDGIHKLVARSLAAGSPRPDIEQAVKVMQECYAAHLLEQTTLYPGVTDALAELSRHGCRLAIVTNKPQAPARHICREFGIESFFAAILGGDSCSRLKPYPEPLLLALQLTGTCVVGSWMVGDNHTDLAAARNAGLRRCFCRYGFGRQGNEAYDEAVDAVSELVDVLTPRRE